MARQTISQGVKERWKAVVGYSGYYEVSTHGRVRSKDRWIVFSDGRHRFFKGKLLKLKWHNSYPYKLAAICRGQEDKKWRTVHQLVMEAFVGPCPPGLEICHNKLTRSNWLTNLRYDTRKNNFADMIRHGTRRYGLQCAGAKVPVAQVKMIRQATGTMDQLSARFKLSRTHIWNIQNYKRRANG